MQWKNLSIGSKLAVGFGTVLLLLVLLGFRAVRGTEEVLEGMHSVTDAVMDIYLLKVNETSHLAWSTEVAQGLILEDMEQVAAQADHTQCEFGKWYYGPERKVLETEHPELVDSIASLDAPHKAMHHSLTEMKELYRRDGAAAMPRVRQIFMGETLVALEKFRGNLRVLEGQVSAVSQAVRRAADQTAHQDLLMIQYGAMTAVVLGILMAVGIGRGIVRPLSNVVQAADAIATGDLHPAIGDTVRKDEVGMLAKAFQRMITSLQQMAGVMEGIAAGDLRQEVPVRSNKDEFGASLRTMGRNLREMTEQIQHAMNTLGASISQISVTTAELSSSAAETAAAMSETTATVEEVRQTASLTNQKARGVSERSKEAVRVALEGKAATDAVFQAMAQIREKMDSIAQGIIALSEKSQRIGDIILAVNDLADQSNVLAVNASIEASRAGEEGRGFAVVAREIRSLAEQSKQSTAEIRGILEEIRKATTSAVLSTEEGGKAVARGETQVAQAAQSIQGLVEVASKDAQAAAQIAASSQEELAGMEQVAQAMESIRQASDQNVESARQLDQSLHALGTLANELTALLSLYKI
ncbi:putative methyl-accepting chemotaxis sensory transducer [Megalodesulfovibrio gigas DSM 1382 = ATCC 19364]|uniref:Putative methyl-accepting chemotaxis sensory transducer n=2 Tax=Megalodesulfovibrio gigas TaxID=879 RepID=T2GCT9_MEGG1|nr:putative methyl-accepting chemotaxis sensory transducer [Megalodesulfovibrio gigas DSM 1382 = ATCC 19364]